MMLVNRPIVRSVRMFPDRECNKGRHQNLGEIHYLKFFQDTREGGGQ